MKLPAKECMLIAPIGFTPNYKRVKYVFFGEKQEEMQEDWLSCIPLIRHAFGDDAKDIAVILIYPENESVIKAIEKGYEKTDKQEERESVINRLAELGVHNVHRLGVRDESLLSEEDMWEGLKELHEMINSLREKGKTKVVFDLTHSYRHLSFAGFVEAMLISDFFEDMDVIEVYYALAKQPLNQGDPVRYVSFRSFIDFVRSVGRIKEVVQKIRPQDLRQIIQEFRKEREIKGTFKSWIEMVPDLLYRIQIGEISDDVLDMLRELLAQDEKSILGEIEGADFDMRIMYSMLRKELEWLYSQFIDPQTKEYVRLCYRQLALARIVAEKQNNVLLTYLYLRESLISWFEEFLEKIGEKADRKTADYLLGRLAQEARKKREHTNESEKTEKEEQTERPLLVTFANFAINNIGEKRNMYAHVMTGRKQSMPKQDLLKREMEKIVKNIDKVEQMLKKMDDQQETLKQEYEEYRTRIQ